MKVKESYTFDELIRGLTMPMSKFCQLAGITEPTLIRLRNGYAGRQSTLNLILAAFSKVYGIEFDLSNVTGLTLQEKPNQKGKKHPVSTPTIDDSIQPASPQKSIVEPKRAYAPRKSDLPDGTILASKFAENHGISRTTFIGHMNEGLGLGLIGYSTDTIPERDRVKYEERNKRVRKDGTIEKEKYLTRDQQHAALEFWKRHDVAFSVCDQADCSCH